MLAAHRPGPRPGRVPRAGAQARRVLVGLALAAALGACGAEGTEPTVQTLRPATSTTTSVDGPGATTAPGTSRPTGPGRASIGSFEIRNDLSCIGSPEVTLRATYTTTGAASVAFVVDGTQVAGTPPVRGTFDVPISCDDRAHTVVLVAVDPDGRTTVESRVVLTSTTPKGN